MTYDENCTALATATNELEEVLNASGEADKPLTEDETKRCDELETQIQKLNTDIAKHKEDTARRKRLEIYKQTLGDPRDLQAGKIDPADVANVARLIESPKPRSMGGLDLYPGRLQSFTGEDGREHAYKAGVQIMAACHPQLEARTWATKRCEELGVEMLANVFKEGTNVFGGYLVYPEFEAAIVKMRNEYGVLRRTARIKPMGSDTLSQPRRVSGLTVYYPEEGGEITASDKMWDRLSITAKKMAALARWSTELDEDAIISMADELAEEIAFAFSKSEDENGFIGTGTSTYGGMRGIVDAINDAAGVTYAGSIQSAAAANLAFSSLDLTDFGAVIGKVPQYARGFDLRWYISHAGFWASMARLVYAAGGNVGEMLASGIGLRFMGIPVEIVDVMNSTLTDQTSTVVCLLGALRRCVYLGTRRGVTIKTSDQRYFELDQLAIQGTQRIGISCYPGDPEAPTTAGGPVIALKTPAA